MLNKLTLKCTDSAFSFDHVSVMITYMISDSNSTNKRVTDNYSPTTSGVVTLEWPNEPAPKSDISFIIIGAGQNVLLQKSMTLAELKSSTNMTMEFDTGSFKLEHASDVAVIQTKPFIYGRLIEANGLDKMEDIQLVFERKLSEGEEFEAFATVRTESNGYFFIDNPKRSFIAVRVRVGMKLEENPLSISLSKEEADLGMLPSRIILMAQKKLIEEADDNDTNDCGCDGLQMHGPRKVVEEFSYFSVVRTTEPEIMGYVLEDEDEISLEDLLKKHPVKRGAIKEAVVQVLTKNLGASESVGTAGDIGIATPGEMGVAMARRANTEAPEVKETMDKMKISSKVLKEFLSKEKEVHQGNIEKLLQLNEASGFRKGLESKPNAALARTVADGTHLIQWDGNATIYQAVSVAHGHLLHYKSEWISDGYSLGDLIYSLPLAPGQKKQIATFGWKRRESARNSQQLDAVDRLEASIEHDRDIFEITKGAFSESISGNSSATTASASASAGGVLGGVLFGVSGGVGHSSSNSNQKGMRNTTASDLQKISDRVSQSASSVRSQRSTVIQTVSQGEELTVETESVANYNHCHAMTIQYFEVLRHFKVRHRLADARECVFVPLLMSQFDLDKTLNWRETLIRHLKRPKLSVAFEAARRVRSEWVGSDIPNTTFAAERILTANGNMRISFVLRRPVDDIAEVDDHDRPIYSQGVLVGYHKIKTDVINLANWESFRPFLGTNTPESFYAQYLSGKKHKDAIFHQMLGETIAREFVNSLRFSVSNDSGAVISTFNIDPSLTSRYMRDGVLNVRLRFNGPSSFPRGQMIFLNVNTSAAAVPANCTIVVKDAMMRYRTAHYEGSLFKFQSLNDDLSASDGMVIYTGPSQEELKNPRMEDIDLTNALIEHLNDHLEYYHKWIWLSLTDQRRFMILDGIILNNPKAEGKSLASLVVNELIGIVGNSLVFPVAPGLNIDPRFSLTDSLLEYYMVAGSEPSTVSVPTEGVFAEAMMGNCNSCEKIDDSRFWRWEESPIPDSPTSIGEVSTDSRRSDPGNLAANPFANPVINIQNAPAVSDPSGVGGTLSLLGKSDSFRDATGLTGNQQNALSALQSSYQATQSISQAAAGLESKRMEEATKIEQAKIMERRLDKAIGTINTSKVLTDGQKQQLIEQAVSGYLGGGSSPKQAALPDVATRIQQAQQVSTAVGNLVANKQISQETADAINKSTWQKAAFESSAQMTTIPVERMQDLLSSTGNAIPGSTMEYRKGDEALSISTGKIPTVDPGSSTNGGTSGGQSGQGGTGQVSGRLTVVLKPLVPILEHSIDPAIDNVKRRNLISAADPLMNTVYLKSINSQAFQTALNSVLPLGQQSDIAITVYDLSSGSPLELYNLNPNLAYSPQFMSNIAGVIGLLQLTKDVETFHSPYIGQMSFDKALDSYSSWLEFKGIPICDQPYLKDIYSGVTAGGSFTLRQEVMDSLRGLNTADSIGILSSTLLGYFYTASVLLSYDLVNYFVSSSPKAINNSITEGMWQKEMLPNSVTHLAKTLTRGTWKARDPFDLYFTGGNGFVTASSLTNLLLNLIQGRFADAGHSSFVNAFLDVNNGGFLNPNISVPTNWIGSEISALNDLTTASHDVVHFKNTALSKEFVAVVLVPQGNSNLVNSIFQVIFANV